MSGISKEDLGAVFAQIETLVKANGLSGPQYFLLGIELRDGLLQLGARLFPELTPEKIQALAAAGAAGVPPPAAAAAAAPAPRASAPQFIPPSFEIPRNQL
ncbi:uncharacterized protein LOC62_01G001256 [Vanrija pseudolonga]|uniref:Uncharacterized protein n=1 Tax=Vanrija pseudolonga TaxID=143232 RepID=A0AAF0Y6J1_9TREE|nr:hypothetical protein LOC62_01G001256 [Vanrija pseudolonga]